MTSQSISIVTSQLSHELSHPRVGQKNLKPVKLRENSVTGVRIIKSIMGVWSGQKNLYPRDKIFKSKPRVSRGLDNKNLIPRVEIFPSTSHPHDRLFFSHTPNFRRWTVFYCWICRNTNLFANEMVTSFDCLRDVIWLFLLRHSACELSFP